MQTKDPREVTVKPRSQKLEYPKHSTSGRELYAPQLGQRPQDWSPCDTVQAGMKRGLESKGRGQPESDHGEAGGQLGVCST